MAHKTKSDRQREAMERKRKYLPSIEESLLDAVKYAEANPAVSYAIRRVDECKRSLHQAYLDAGFSAVEVPAMVNSTTAGRLGAWIGSTITSKA